MIIDLLANHKAVLILLAINLIASISYLLIVNNESLKNSYYSLPSIIQKIYVVFFVGPLFAAPFFQQKTFVCALPGFHPAGIIVLLTGLVFITASFFKIGVVPAIKRKSELSTTGIYGIVRHPIYAGTILVFSGLILYFQPVIPALYIPVSIMLYFCMAVSEEKDLIISYGDEYLSYKMKVRKRIIPFVL